MRSYIRAVAIAALGFGAVSLAHADGCVGGTPCQPPVSLGISGHTITTINASARNSATATPNATNSIYFFEATTGGSATNVEDPVNGTVKIVAIVYFGSGNPNDVIPGPIQPVVGGTTYNVFVKVCPPGTSVTDSGCTAWVSMGSVGTTSYPANPGFPNIASADTAPRQFTARTSGVQDFNNVIGWQFEIVNDDAKLPGGNSGFITQQPFSGSGSGVPGNGAGVYLLDNNDYGSLLPNLGYHGVERLIYFYNKLGPDYTTPRFYTQPVDPVPGAVSNITHCSARLDFTNAASNPANPNDSQYTVNVGGAVLSGSASQTVTIGGTGIFSDGNFVTYTNLQAGTLYNPTLVVPNRGGGSWRPSTTVSFASFNTISWNGSFSVTNRTTTGATFNVITLNTTGITSWQMQIDGSPVGSPTAGVPPATIPITGLNPNTSHTARILLNETSGCTSALPTTAIQFYTLPAAPTGGSWTAAGPRDIQAGWTDANPPAGNPNGASYRLQSCTQDPNINPGSCTNKSPNPTKSGTNVTSTINNLLPETQYWGRVQTIAASGSAADDSAWLSLGNLTTPNEDPSVVSGPTTVVHITSATLSVVATDNGGPSHLRFLWNVTVFPSGGSPSLTSANGTTVIAGNNATNTTQVTFQAVGTYGGTVVITDHDGTGGQSITVPWSTNSTSIPTTVVVSPANTTIGTGQTQTFTVVVRDQNGVIMAPTPAVTWSITAPANGNTINSSGLFTANALGTYQVRATVNSNGVNGATNVTVNPTVPSFALNGDPSAVPHITSATLTALGQGFNGEPAITYTWSLVSKPTGALDPDFAPNNGTNAAKNSFVTLHAAGQYTLQCLLRDTVNSLTNSKNVTFTINQSVDRILVATPDGKTDVTVQSAATQPFVASGLDQFGNPITLNNIQWSVLSGNGNISGSGIFNSNSIGQKVIVRALDPATGKFGTATVTVVSFDVSGAIAFPVPYKSTVSNSITFRGVGNDAKIRVYTASGREVWSLHVTPTNGEYVWDVKNSSGERLASGVYFYVIESTQGKKDGKLIIIQ